MKRLWLTLTAALLLAAVSADAQEKWVRGTVSGVGSDSITVKSMDTEMKFTVSSKTSVVARGAGTAAQAAEEKGRTGVKLGDFLKVGERVEVHYTESGAAMTATWIRVGIMAGDAKSQSRAEQGSLGNGTVTAVNGSSLTVMAGGKEMRFALDSSTAFVGSGLGTKVEAAGRKLTPAEVVGKGDVVTVLYEDRAGSMHAIEVRIRRKAGS